MRISGRNSGDAAQGKPTAVGDALVYADRNEVAIEGEVRRIKPKAMQVLARLIETAGDVVSKQALLDAAWPQQTVSESVLTEAIHEIRKAFGDDARSPRYVQTLSRTGYRLIAPVRGDEPAEADEGEPRIPRVAVSHFESLGSDPEDRYFCEGICEEITNQLGKCAGIEVLARTSTLQMGGREIDARQRALDMGATHLVDGSLRRHGERVRVSVRLVEVASATQQWSEVYDETLTDLFDLQHRIAVSVRNTVAPRLSGDGQVPVANVAAPRSKAFREFSKGRYFWKLDNLNPQRAMEHYESACRMEPDYAAPFAGMLECLNTLAVFHVVPQHSVRDDAIRYAERALFLAPDDPDSLFAFGYMQFYLQWDWDTASQAFGRCLEANPNHPLAHGFLSLLNAALRREELARHHALSQTRLDPFSAVAWLHLALHYRYFHHYEQSLSAAREGLELRENDVVLRWVELDSLLRLGRVDGLLESVRKLETATAENYPMFHALTALQFRTLGDDAGVGRIEERLETHFRERWPDPFTETFLAIARDDADAAVRLLESAFDDRDTALWLINCDPSFEMLEGHSRLIALRERMRLPVSL